ncbi:NfeD family protein [Arsenophonus endosymbiont of Bemisia tabaci]|uniref:NfeD family protein n=1 Tax=Arsenophonus endosymbiont of Bemisia tabaci TaxID=536059 RepID=UPI0015F6E688|nr:Inner membrane protein YbbJ [Arsenophonus endosymbiont of Bemisia tabaci Q2]
MSQKHGLISDTNNGYSRIRLADGSWPVYCSQELLANTEVKVIDVDGITLTVKPVWSNQHDDQPDDQ